METKTTELKQKYKQLKELIKNKELKTQLKIAICSGFNLKMFSFFVKLNNGLIAHVFYTFLFFIRNNFTSLYKKLRRK